VKTKKNQKDWMEARPRGLTRAARSSSPPADDQRSSDRRTLAPYFGAAAAYDLLDADAEAGLARQIEAADQEVWVCLLSHPHTVEYIAAFVAARLPVARTLAPVRRAAAAARASRTKLARQRLSHAAERAGRSLRQQDQDHACLDLVVAELARLAGLAAEVRGHLGFSPTSRGFRTYADQVQQAAQRATELRHRFVAANLRLVAHLATRYAGSGVPLPDLIQEGNLGLMKAVDRFDYRRGYRFSTYATWWIRHMIGRSVANTSQTVRVPVHLQDASHRLTRMENELSARLGRRPSDDELAREADVSLDRLHRIRLRAGKRTISLDEPAGEDRDRSLLDTFSEPEVHEPTPLDQVIERTSAQRVWSSLEQLTPQQADIIRKRFALEHDREWTLQEIADVYGLSRERIRQIQDAALARLRRSLEHLEAPPERQAG
jgi:RNA polymerase primary sigma factor